jgi:hypothetical protein
LDHTGRATAAALQTADPATAGNAVATERGRGWRDPEDSPQPAGPIEAVLAPEEADLTWERLENHLKWYSSNSRTSQCWYKRLKLLEAGGGCGAGGRGAQPVWVTGSLAAVLVVLEGAQHL